MDYQEKLTSLLKEFHDLSKMTDDGKMLALHDDNDTCRTEAIAAITALNKDDLTEQTRLARVDEREKQALEVNAAKFSDYLQSKEPVEVARLLAVSIYLYIMEPTNATDVSFKISEFTRNGEVLGDMKISAQLAPKPEKGQL